VNLLGMFGCQRLTQIDAFDFCADVLGQFAETDGHDVIPRKDTTKPADCSRRRCRFEIGVLQRSMLRAPPELVIGFTR
jgi:hypothetical protein